ncbi:MAG: hypothetical protein JNK48_04720 [Bryobacterales bacterium]|nr:hypothetical protein [Bryobacterales bacterium]
MIRFSAIFAYTGGGIRKQHMEITLGPWTAEKNIRQDVSKPLLDAMADEAMRMVKRTEGFNGRVPPPGETKAPGFNIIGRLISIAEKSGSSQVTARFNVNVDGFMSNMATLEGKATASGGMTAEDALRAVVETRVQTILKAIQAGRIVRQG